MKINILIGGEAGQGLKTTFSILGKALFRMEFNLFSTKDYMSRIRGGHNFIKLRVGDEKITGPADEIDILVALNKETVKIHEENVKNRGVIISEEKADSSVENIVIPAGEIAKDVNPRALNTVFVGAVLKALGVNTDNCQSVIREYFNDSKIIEDNLQLLEKGYQKGKEVLSLPENTFNNEQLFLDGNQALALGALSGGLKYYSAYPMSPSTSIMNFVAQKQKDLKVVVEQAEDEIAAINMALGASYGGIRSMTGTSGGGLALMNEGIGLAGITETPLVIVDVQRPGPATGLPTRTSQADLLFAINSSQGEFPLMVTAPRNHEVAFYDTFRALNLADKYQIPVLILSDQFLADSSTNIDEFDLSNLSIDSYFVDKEDFNGDQEYKRYNITDTGISPRAYPGQLEQTFTVDSDEHDEYGHIIEDGDTRNNMVEKRASKEEKLKSNDIKEPLYTGQPAEEIDYLLIGYGSTYGPIKEAVSLLQEDKLSVGYLSFTDIWPLPVKKLLKFNNAKIEFVCIENNYRGQFATLISQETGIQIEHNILKYNGRPFSGIEIYNRIKKEVIQ